MNNWFDIPAIKELGGKPLMAASIFNDLPEPIPWAVEGFVVESGFTAFSGPGGIGKSYILIELAIALATGKPFFDYIPVARPYRVLYIDMEMLAGATKLRFQRMMKGRFQNLHPLLEENLFVMGQGALNIDNRDSLAALKHLIEENHIDFVLIDSYRQIFNGDEKDSQFTVRVFKALSGIRNATSCGFVCIDHVRKPQQPKPGEPAMKETDDVDAAIIGSANKLNNLDNNIAVRRGTLPDSIYVIPGKDRHGEGSQSKVDPFHVVFEHVNRDDPTGPFRLIYKPAANTAEEKTVVAYLRTQPNHSAPIKQVQLETSLSAKAVQRVGASLSQRNLLKRGWVGRVWTFSLQLDNEPSGQIESVHMENVDIY